MKYNKANVFIRIQTYYTLLAGLNDPDNISSTITIENLQTHTGWPVELIRNDLAQIIQWQIAIENSNQDNPLLRKEKASGDIINYISFELDDTEYEYLLDSGMTKENCEKLQKLILDGSLDEISLYISCPSYHLLDLPLTYDEAVTLESLNKDIQSKTIQSKTGSSFEKSQVYLQIKDTYRATHCYRDLIQKLEKLEQAITSHHELSIAYRTNRGKIIPITLRPLKISYDETENLYCVLSASRGHLLVNRLDNIVNLEYTADPDKPGKLTTDDEKAIARIEEIAPQVWGNCFSEAPEHIKVRFYDEANVWEKVRRDLACRTKGQLYEKDGFLYYEDTVYGISKFRPWVYSFGSSAIVLEPKSLREHIIASLKERKNREQ